MIRLEWLALVIVPWIVYRGIVLVVKGQFSLKVEVIKTLFFFSVYFIYALTLFPFPFYLHAYIVGDEAMVNLVPFVSMYEMFKYLHYLDSLRNIGGNILLFIPLGLAIPLRFGIVRLRNVVLFGFLASLFVEGTQLLFIPVRAFDVDDLILNTLGTMIGFLACKQLFNRKQTVEEEVRMQSFGG